MNYDAIVLSCMSGNRGISITPQLATLRSEQKEITTRYKENEHLRLSFVVEKKAVNRLIYCYINGIMSGVVQYPADDDFAQSVPVDISIGSRDAAIDLYCIRVYDNDLTRHQVLNNWIADTQVVETMLERYSRNHVFDAYSQIVISQLPKDLPYLVLDGTELPQYKGDVKTMSGYYTDPVNGSKSFTFSGAEVDVQGTSSQYYARKNYKIKFKGGFVDPSGNTQETYKLRPDSVPTNTFTFKADVASSEGANNVELARLYDETCPFRTAPQKQDSRIRQGIDGFPIVVFWYDGENTSFIGKYNFNFDKATPEVFGFAEGDESWEILNNTSDRVLWKDDDYSGTDWQGDFEARYPKDYADPTNLSELAAWLKSTDQSAATGDKLTVNRTFDGVLYTTDTAAYRLAKFKSEFAQHFEKDAVLFYYLFTELFLMVDSRAKNMFPTFMSGSKWFSLPYDFDTAIGINNEGALVFSYNLEDIDHTESGADIYNGQQSVLWINVRAAFFEDIKAMYQKLRSNGTLSFPVTEQRFEEHQAKWPEAVFNEDAYFKYLQPLIEQNTASYLTMLQGSKAEQRKWWLYNRFRYLDSKYNAGDALTDVVTLRGYAKDDITVTPYADIYATVKYGSYLVQQRANRNVVYTLSCPLSNVNDTEIYIYSASQLQSIGDLSGLMVGYADFSMATRLQSLKVGDAADNYSNGNLTELYLGNNTLLRTLDVRNCPNLKQAVDVSGCTNIEHLYFEGTAVTGVQLPNGGILKTLHLPATVTNLTIRNQKAITDFSIGGYDNISTLRLENVSEVFDLWEILHSIPAGARVRVTGLERTFEDAAGILAFYDLLDTMRGLDENGNNVDKAQIVGCVFVSELYGTELEEMLERYPNIKVMYTTLTSYLRYYDDSGKTLYYTETITNGGDGKFTGYPNKDSTAENTFSFVGWSREPGGTVDSECRKAVLADRNVYAVYKTDIRKYTVWFYNENTLLQTVTNVPYGSAATYTGDTPVKDKVSEPELYPFERWDPSPRKIIGDTKCYAQFGSPVELKEIEDDWDTIIANINDGIATQLTADGIKSPGGKDKWNAGAVRSILTNEKYKGDALLQKSYTVDFLTKKKKVNEGEIPQYYVEGNHEAIISPDVFEQVQRELERRKQGKGRHSGVHLFSGKIKCGQCGEWYGSKVWHSNSKYRRVIWQCNHKFDGDEKCATPHLTEEDIKMMFVSAVNQLITQKDAIIAVLTASLDTAFDLTALKAEQAELESEMTVVSDLIQKCIYENAHVALDQVEYQKRYDGLTARFDAAKARYESLDETIRSKQSRRATIEDFLATLKDANLVDTFDTALWCGLVDFVTVHSKDDVRFTFKNGQEIKA